MKARDTAAMAHVLASASAFSRWTCDVVSLEVQFHSHCYTNIADAVSMASRPANTSKRTSAAVTTEPIAKPPCKIHSLAVVSEKAQITGSHTVELCDNSVLHPHCKVKAEHGIVYVGRSTIICEATIIGVTEGEGNVIIGDGVLIEAGATIEAKSIGDGTVIEAKAKIGKGAMIGKVLGNHIVHGRSTCADIASALQDQPTERDRCG